jgi:cytochrome c biogenesis protein CcmG, thiol:disulfide interchange protein DsbE
MNTCTDMRRRRLLHLLAAATAAAVAAPRALAIAEGRAAPAFSATLFDGKPFALGDAHGKVVLLNFWATWCAPCREEMPAIDAFYRKHRDDGLVVVAVSMDRSTDEAKARALMHAYAFPAAFGNQASFEDYGRIWRLPLTFVVDRQGVLRRDQWYEDPGISEASLDRVVAPLLAR